MTGDPLRVVPPVALLAAGAVAWAAVPMTGAAPGARPALIAAICFATLSVTQLAGHILADRPEIGPRRAESYVPAVVRLWQGALFVLRAAPSAQSMIIAVLAVEALHRSRPWHTAVLGVVLLAYLLAVHLAETGARVAALRPQLPLMAAGIGLTALSIGAAALSGTGLGSDAVWLAALAAVAAVIAAAMMLPI